MTRKEIKNEQTKFEEYTKALKYVYADGNVSSTERNRLITLKNELGLTDSDCQNLEGPYKLIASNAEKNERTTFEDLCKCHHCHCFDHDGEIHFHAIDYSPIEYLEIGDTYIEITAAGFTGLKENFAVSIGQSFKDLINEYGEEHIYDAIKDGKLQTFDDSCNYDDMVDWILNKFNLLNMEGMKHEYLKPLDDENIIEYAEHLKNEGYQFDNNLDPSDDYYKGHYSWIRDFIEHDDDYEVNVLQTPILPEKNTSIVAKDFSDDRENDTYYTVELQGIKEYFHRCLEEKREKMDIALSQGMFPHLINVIDRGPAFYLPVDIEYKISFPSEVFDYIRNKGKNPFDAVLEQIDSAYVKGSSLIDDKVQTPFGKVEYDVTLRHNYSVSSDTDYENFPYDEVKEKLPAAIGLALNMIVPDELKAQGKIFTLDIGDVSVPSVFYLNNDRDRIEVTPQTYVEFNQSDEEFVNSLNLSVLRYVNSTVLHELEHFRKDKQNFNKVLEENPKLKQYLENTVAKEKEQAEKKDIEVNEKIEKDLTGECVDASFALYPPENNLEKSKSDKEIIQTYISKIKETLPASMKNSVETVLASSAKALSLFSREEKLVIGKYLTENGVTNSDNLGNFLKKKVEPEHKKELKRDFEIERGR